MSSADLLKHMLDLEEHDIKPAHDTGLFGEDYDEQEQPARDTLFGEDDDEQSVDEQVQIEVPARPSVDEVHGDKAKASNAPEGHGEDSTANVERTDGAARAMPNDEESSPPKGKCFAQLSSPGAFQSVAEQVTTGIARLKAVSKVLSKLAQAEEEYAQKIAAIVEEALSIGTTGRTSSFFAAAATGKDMMNDINDAWRSTLLNTRKCGEQHAAFAKTINLKLIATINNQALVNTEKFKEVADTHSKQAHEVEGLHREYLSKRNQTHRALTAMKRQDQIAKEKEEEEAQAAKAKTTTGATGLFKKFRRAIADRDPEVLKHKAYDCAVAFQKAIADSNAAHKRYYEEQLPTLFEKMEQIETNRLECAKRALGTFGAEQAKYLAVKAQITENVASRPKELNTQKQVEEYVTSMEEKLDTRERDQFHLAEYDAAASPDDIKAGRHTAQPNSIFHATLQRCMELQEAEGVDMKVPRILQACIDGFKANNGFQSEGVFRISIATEELESLITQVDSGDYNLSSDNPHAYCALMKHWMRRLDDQIIPEVFYERAIKLAKEKAKANVFLALVKELDTTNAEVVKAIASLCKEISNPGNVVVNRMSMKNLSLIFAPSFLRNPSDDPAEMLANARYESEFLLGLFEAL